MIIESNKANLKHSIDKTYQFVSDFSNFPKLLPEEKVKVKDVSADHIVFEIQGMATIGMKVSAREANTIKVVSEGKNPFDFTMEIKINSTGDQTSEAFLVFNGNVNPFLKMMVEKPLTNFFNALADKLQTIELK